MSVDFSIQNVNECIRDTKTIVSVKYYRIPSNRGIPSYMITSCYTNSIHFYVTTTPVSECKQMLNCQRFILEFKCTNIQYTFVSVMHMSYMIDCLSRVIVLKNGQS